MKAWAIFVHSVRQVFGNLGAALRVSLLPFALIVVIGLAAMALGMQTSGGMPMMPGAMLLPMLLIVVVYVVLMVTIAVNWHRHILLAEPVGWLPLLRGRQVLAYLGRLILVALVMVAVGVALFALVTLLTGQNPAAITVLGVAVLLAMLTLNWRLSAALPGAAVDGGRGFAAALAATRGQWPTLLGLSAIYLAAAVALGMLVGLVAAIPLIGVLADLAANWVGMMVGLSVLTTLYGHYIEGRPLV